MLRDGGGRGDRRLDSWTRHDAWVDTFVVTQTPFPPPPGVTLVHDTERHMHERYGEKETGLCLVRPDGYVAQRRAGLDGFDE